MFCYQCEQATGGTGCTKNIGACGKSEDIQSLQDTLLYGLKGIAAYAYHARELGAKDDEVDAFMHEALFETITNVSFDLNQHLEYVLRCGYMNLRAMEMLDKAHTARFGNPVPTQVETGTKHGPGILVTGHDLLALHELLKQTDGTGINVYTHSEMLPAHGYPGLKKFKHLVGNYGGAWQEQRKEFAVFHGPILVTTNCVMIPPVNTYLNRLFTLDFTGVPGAAHIRGFDAFDGAQTPPLSTGKQAPLSINPERSRRIDFTPVIKKAKETPSLPEAPGIKIMTGFHHTAILGLADKIVAAVKAGRIRRFFLIGGCDGAKPGRNYYTEFAEQVPDDCVILTVACGKYRFNKLDFGAIDGIPRLLDLGQCNDAYSGIQVALALAKVFNCGVNDLPLTFVLSWFEQKAVAILLTLLYLGVKGIRIGPTLPAFISKDVLRVLVDKFDLKPITTARDDLAAALVGS